MPDVTIDMHSDREVVKRYVVGLNENTLRRPRDLEHGPG
jgi:hypothetical protein